MGIYVNPVNRAFIMSRFSEIYIDKSMLIERINKLYNTEKRFICVSRPRRFGKSMAANMLAAYYSRGCDSAKLFAGLKIETAASFPHHLNRHNVIRLDIQQFLESRRDLPTFIAEIERAVREELAEVFPECGEFPADSRLKTVLNKIFSRTGQSFIFIIDEWDCVFRVAKEQQETQKEYLDFLRGLFKGQDYTELVYMTGILPVKKYGEHSALNIFDEYSIIEPKGLGAYFGFTEEEVRRACQRHSLDYTEMEKWYNGYLLEGSHIYNPKSVADALIWKKFKSYWTGTETYEALKIYIDLNFDGLREAIIGMLSGIHFQIDTSTSQNDMTTFRTKDDVLTLLIHLGYLAYDENAEEVFIPNQEIAQEFLRAIKIGGWDGLMQAFRQSEELLKHTWALDGKAVAEGMETIHNETASMLKYNDENSLTCTVLIAYYSAKAYYLNPVLEMPSGKGFADVVYLPRRNTHRPALVVELKWDKSAEGALRQVKDKQYAHWLKGYTGDILLVGINYDRESKAHECVIEKYVY
jgi:hypothetical protein